LKIIEEIKGVIPVWFNKHSEMQHSELTLKNHQLDEVCCREYDNSLYQLGTLWWWNHFIEIQKWDDGHIWIMIHSWSRNLWKQVADYYNKRAIELNNKWYSQVIKDLAFLPVDSEEWKAYIREMNYCIDYALANRKLMMNRCLDSFNKFIKTEELEFINIAHNYARLESHWWKNVWVHRKWATSARKWEIGIIPWSQWTKSYIVEWLGNKESFMSCSHWAGRNMWRREAQRSLNLKEEQDLLNKQWIIHSIKEIKDLDEAPSAYKNIDTVMEEQKDLVKIKTELTPLAVIKW